MTVGKYLLLSQEVDLGIGAFQPAEPYILPDSSGISALHVCRHANLRLVHGSSFHRQSLERPYVTGVGVEKDKGLNSNIMSSQSFLPLSSPPESPRLLPRRPSLDRDREILSTRGQRILSLLPSRVSSSTLKDLEEHAGTPPTFLRRGSQLIGHSNARYEWYVVQSRRYEPYLKFLSDHTESP